MTAKIRSLQCTREIQCLAVSARHPHSYARLAERANLFTYGKRLQPPPGSPPVFLFLFSISLSFHKFASTHIACTHCLHTPRCPQCFPNDQISILIASSPAEVYALSLCLGNRVCCMIVHHSRGSCVFSVWRFAHLLVSHTIIDSKGITV